MIGIAGAVAQSGNPAAQDQSGKPAANSADAPKDVKGLFLLTDYPALSVRPGTTASIALRLQNYGLSPERYQLSVADVPPGWTATLLGGGQPVAAAMPATDSNVGLQLRLDVPANVAIGTQTLDVYHCPGHTPGHVVFHHMASGLALVGDVLFRGSIGRSDLPRGNHADLIRSIVTKLWPLGPEVTFVPGHGALSTFGRERRDNPYVADAVLTAKS